MAVCGDAELDVGVMAEKVKAGVETGCVTCGEAKFEGVEAWSVANRSGVVLETGGRSLRAKSSRTPRKACAGPHINQVMRRISLPRQNTRKRIKKMLNPDRFHIADRSEVKFLIPLEQFLFVRDQRHHLSPGDMHVKQCLRVVNKFFHW